MPFSVRPLMNLFAFKQRLAERRYAKEMKERANDWYSLVVPLQNGPNKFAKSLDIAGVSLIAGQENVQHSILVPLCSNYEDGVIALDPDGKLRDACSAIRSEKGRVFCIAPNGIVGTRSGSTFSPHGVNPLNTLCPDSPDFMSRSAEIARILLGHPRGGGYFHNSAETLLTAIIASEVALARNTPGCSVSLRDVFRTISLPASSLQALLYWRFVKAPDGSLGNYHSAIVGLGIPFYDMSEDTWSGITTTITSACRWLADCRYSSIVCSDTIVSTDLFEKRASVFVSIDRNDMRDYPAIVDLILMTLMSKGVRGKRDQKRVLVIARDVASITEEGTVLANLAETAMDRNVALVGTTRSLKFLESELSVEGFLDWYANLRTCLTLDDATTASGFRFSSTSTWLVEGLGLNPYKMDVENIHSRYHPCAVDHIATETISENEPQLLTPVETLDAEAVFSRDFRQGYSGISIH
ncbi:MULTISPECIES: type IV secretory system conjugative DNA transfer family protein [unclassified Pannonibacter]|uniref:type IV secretory system conjugative DNA transfer family protein n=1 Tax=unclassified Pannonibacter TaxID=2627228 RepID=UPI001644AB6E|nr:MULTISPECIES: type IV secretory system conjugative DNA transfer family protein [unclassified Pannonibacter]